MQQIDRLRCFAVQNPACKIDYHLFACESENIEHIALVDFFSAKGDELIEHRFRIAKTALRAARDRMRRSSLERDLLFLRNELQVLRNQIRGNAMQIEPLTTAENGRQNFLRLGGGENKFHMLGRLFQRLQKRIE